MRKLVLRRETVRTLANEILEQVAGGSITQPTTLPSDTYSQSCHTYAGCTTLGGSCPKRLPTTEF